MMEGVRFSQDQYVQSKSRPYYVTVFPGVRLSNNGIREDASGRQERGMVQDNRILSCLPLVTIS